MMMDSGTTVHICFTVDESYIAYMAVCMASILDNADDETMFHFHIISAGLSSWMERKILELRCIKDFFIEFITFDHSKISNFPSYYKRSVHINDVSLYRLKLASLLPELDKVIYLDADTVLLTNIARLRSIDLTDRYLAAVDDPVFEVDLSQHSRKFSDWRSFHKAFNKDGYINAGVLLINLKKWREDNVEALFIKLSDEYSEHILFPDQDLLNIAFGAAIVKLDGRWNVTLEILKSFNLPRSPDPYIIHWAGKQKPWHGVVEGLGEYVFWHYAARTPFLDYLKHVWARSAMEVQNGKLELEIARHDHWLHIKLFVVHHFFQVLAKVTTGTLRSRVVNTRRNTANRMKQLWPT